MNYNIVHVFGKIVATCHDLKDAEEIAKALVTAERYQRLEITDRRTGSFITAYGTSVPNKARMK